MLGVSGRVFFFIFWQITNRRVGFVMLLFDFTVATRCENYKIRHAFLSSFTVYSVGKQSPCLLSFVYTSYIRYGVRAARKFGKHASLFSCRK